VRKSLDQHEQDRHEEDRDRVANAMPTIVTVPITCLATPPAPSAFQSGARPRMKANDVMRIGRSRFRAPSSAASTIDAPFSSSAFANSTIRSRSSPTGRSA
jgi:hypothetical protein